MWAERKDTIHLTINLPDPVEDTPACSLTPDGRVVWVGSGGPAGATHRYRLDIQLSGGVEVGAAKKAVGARAVVFRLPKAEPGYWGKLTAKKDVHCHVDWSMWKDEDEEEEFDFGTCAQLAGTPGGGAAGQGGGARRRGGAGGRRRPMLARAAWAAWAARRRAAVRWCGAAVRLRAPAGGVGAPTGVCGGVGSGGGDAGASPLVGGGASLGCRCAYHPALLRAVVWRGGTALVT